MKKFRFAFQTFSLAAFFLAFSMIANAQATRTWVSGLGDDMDPCSRTAPCKTFTGALSRTAIGGEINCLDPGGYGAVTITQSITIDCEDTQGAILASSYGITINIGASDTVRLRGLLINGGSTNGIRIISPGKLIVEETVIDGFTAHGISLENSTGAFNLVVKKSTVRNNGSNGINTALSGAATATVFVTDSLFAGNSVGFNQNSATTSVLQSSTFTGNTTGIQASGSTSVLAFKNCQITYNGTGVNAVSTPMIRIGANVITGNATGLAGTDIKTWGGNFVDGNTANGTNNGIASSQ